MEVNMKLKCECGKESEFLIHNKSSIYMSSEVEEGTQNSFYCNVNYSNGMVVNCTNCGNDMKWFI